jgi:hypothetical protein
MNQLWRTFNENKQLSTLVYGVLGLVTGAGTLYCLKEILRRDDILKKLKQKDVSSVGGIEELIASWGVQIKHSENHTSAENRKKQRKSIVLKDQVLVGKLLTQHPLINEKSGSAYLYMVKEI